MLSRVIPAERNSWMFYRKGYMVRVTREKDGYEKVLDEFISRELFETCINTGFLYNM